MAAQFPSCNGNAPLSASIIPSSGGGSFSCKVAECDEQIFDIFLSSTNAQQSYTFNWLLFNANIQIVSANGQFLPLNGYNSYIEVEASKQCTPTIPNSVYSYDRSGNVNFMAGDISNLEPSGAMTFNLSQPLLIMRVVVHAPPGTQLRWETPMETQVIVSQPGGPPFCGTFQTTTPGIVQISSVPSCSNINYSFNFTGGTSYGPQTSVSLPIMFNGGNNVIQELEAWIEVSSSNFMNFLASTSGILPSNTIKHQSTNVGTTHYQNIYINTTSGSLPFIGNGNLLTVNVGGPLNISLASTVTVTVKYLRVKTANGCCNVQSLNGDSRDFYYTGYNFCNDFTLSVEDIVSPDECSVPYKVKLSWPSSMGNSMYFKKLDFGVYFNTKLEVVDITSDNTICNGGGCMSFQYFPSPQLGVLVRCEISDVTLNNDSYFTVFLGGISGCVMRYTVAIATAETSAGTCVPILNPPYVYQNYSRCMSRIGGEVIYKCSAAAVDCDSYHISAISKHEEPSCNFSEVLSGSDMAYSFCVCPEEFPYKVKCHKENIGEYLAGVTTLDLLKIAQHILHPAYPTLPTLPDGFALHAADADCSGSIASADITILRELILGIREQLITNYKLIPVTPLYFPPGSSFAIFCSSGTDKNVSKASIKTNFYVVKTGDCTAPYAPSFSCKPSGALTRSSQTVKLYNKKLSVKAGEVVKIPVVLDKGIAMSAIQMELGFDPDLLQFRGFTQGILNDFGKECLGLKQIEEGTVKIGWFSTSGMAVRAESEVPLLYLEFLALRSIDRAEVLINTGSKIPNVVYGEDDVEFLLENSSSSFLPSSVMYSASPNPFSEDVTLQIWNPEKEGTISILVLDVTGKQVGSYSGTFGLENNTLNLPANLFGNSGVYFLNIRTNKESRTIKVIKE